MRPEQQPFWVWAIIIIGMGLALFALVLTSCSNGDNADTTGAWNDSSSWAPPSNTEYDKGEYGRFLAVQGCYTEEQLKTLSEWFDGLAPQEQAFLGDFKSCINVVISYNIEKGFFDYAEMTIYLNPDPSAIKRRLCHEYAHAIHLSYRWMGYDEDWAVEVVACATTDHFKLSKPPVTCDFDKLFDASNYTTQYHFGHFLMQTYNSDIIEKIVATQQIGQYGFVTATGEAWEVIMKKWKRQG